MPSESAHSGADFFDVKYMPIDLETHPNYSLEQTQVFFEARGWEVERVKLSNSADLYPVDEGSAIECFDGRFSRIARKKRGVKVPGGSNFIAAMKTGSTTVGFNEAARQARQLGVTSGTHAVCGYYGLWTSGNLEAAIYKYIPPVKGLELGEWVRAKAWIWGGKHFKLPGEHEEEALIVNPFLGTTLEPRSDRFSVDKWFVNVLGVSRRRGLIAVAEVVEKLAPQAKRVEILVR